MKINNEIITNIDIENEYKYLIALNKSLNNLNKDTVLELAKNSLQKEIIKKIELDKIYELNQKNPSVSLMISNIYKDLGLNSEEEFKSYLKNLKLEFKDIYKKIEIETVWNQMIYTKYNKKVIINEEVLKEQILQNKKKERKFLFLYELVFDFKNKEEINKKYKEILESIKIKGFEETVIMYSIANTKMKSGLVGWVDINTLNNKIKNEVVNLDIGEISNPISIPSGILLLKVDDKKTEIVEADVDKELEKLIEIELTSQLNNYSTIFYNKIKRNQIINEY
tara:strand:+ start:1181 stop:2023 length:843 start_codon:yes stop_codon:yes gene_type:complete